MLMRERRDDGIRVREVPTREIDSKTRRRTSQRNGACSRAHFYVFRCSYPLLPVLMDYTMLLISFHDNSLVFIRTFLVS